MSHTFIILDGHPAAFAPTARINKELVDPTHQLPLFPLWASMVQSSIEFCRIAWDIQHTKRYFVNVLVAGAQPILLNDLNQQNIAILEQQFPHAQPRQTYSYDRLQSTIESSLRLYLDKKPADALRRCRIILVTIAKQPTEKAFEFRNNPEESPRDLRVMAYEALHNINKIYPSESLSHVQVDVLRLLPFIESSECRIPPKIISKQVSSQISMSIYNIPNGQDDLKYAMKHMAQLYYNINVLHISNIPMKSSEQAQSTRTVTLYYQANGYHLINQQEPLRNLMIHDPTYLKYRELKLVYSKRSKRALPESEWCTCMHTISPLVYHDMATEVYLGMIFKGSISYLVKPETSNTKPWTHILMAQDGAIFLHCLNSKLQHQFSEAETACTRLLTKVKVEDYISDPSKADIPKTTEMLETVIRPNLYENVKQFLHATSNDPLCRLVPLNPSRFSHHLPITHSTLSENVLYTSRSIEKATRWRTCFRDCQGTDRFPITYDNNRLIDDLATDVLNGIPGSSGFGVAFGLIHDLFEQLQDILLKDKIPFKDIKSTKDLISMIVSELVNGMEGFSQKLFIKGLRKEDSKLLSKKLLVALYLVGKRFRKDSDHHGLLCDHILFTIKEKTTKQPGETENEPPIEQAPPVDIAWNQVKRYEKMSLREREDAAQGYLPDFKQEKGPSEPIPFSGQLPPQFNKVQQTGTTITVNQNFRSRRGTSTTAPNNIRSQQQQQMLQQYQSQKRPTYPDPSVAVPYLTYIAPTLEEKAQEEKEEEESLGEPGNLLWLYWMNDKIKKRGNQEEGDLSAGTELVYKNSQWKRVKKEFLGRLAQAGEKGEAL